MAARSPTPKLDALLRAEPDLVDRIFDYLIAQHPDMAALKADAVRQAVRDEIGGQEWYVRRRRGNTASLVLALFNGRNASEVARQLQISRASVYRYLKQPGPQTVSSSPGSETGDRVGSATNPPTP